MPLCYTAWCSDPGGGVGAVGRGRRVGYGRSKGRGEVERSVALFRQLCLTRLHSSPISTGGARYKVGELFVPPNTHPVFSL